MAQSSHHDRRIHPGSGRRRGLDTPKGRQVDPGALAEVQALLGEHTDEVLGWLGYGAGDIKKLHDDGAV